VSAGAVSCLWALVAGGLLVLASCRDEHTPPLALTLDYTDVNSDATSFFLRIATDASVAWTASVTQGSEWCAIVAPQPASGVGSGYASLEISENTATDDRTATITVVAGNASQSVQVKQEKARLLTVTVPTTEVSSEANTLTIQIKTREAWTATAVQEGNFCTLTPGAGTGNASLEARFAANPGLARTVAITIGIESGLTETFSVRQVAPGEVPGGNRPEQVIPNRIELPAVDNRRWYLEHKYYAIEYDTAQKHSVWVAYVLNAEYLQKNVDRQDNFVRDPLVPYEFSSQQSDFYEGLLRYDRGHLMPSGDRVFSREANNETFYYSNMSPQLSGFNGGIWASLEARVRMWAEASDCDTLYIATGGAVKNGIETIRKAPGVLTIPKYYYKALLKRKGNAFDGIGFWMEHQSYPPNSAITHSYSMTIDELEQRTGIDFFPNLPDATENAVEASRNTAKWPL
jgi:endonuclease G